MNRHEWTLTKPETTHFLVSEDGSFYSSRTGEPKKWKEETRFYAVCKLIDRIKELIGMPGRSDSEEVVDTWNVPKGNNGYCFPGGWIDRAWQLQQNGVVRFSIDNGKEWINCLGDVPATISALAFRVLQLEEERTDASTHK